MSLSERKSSPYGILSVLISLLSLGFAEAGSMLGMQPRRGDATGWVT